MSLRILRVTMSHPHSLPDNATQGTENGFLFNDWTLPEKNSAENTNLFDGKIIARMPDLGAECLSKNTEKSGTRSYWGKIGSSIPSASVVRLQLFHRITAFGCVVVLCGLGIVLLEQGDKTTENAPVIAEIVVENVKIPITEFGEIMVSAPIVQPEPTEQTPDLTFPPVILVAPTENVAAAPVAAKGQPDQVPSVWNRPSSDSYSPWHVAQNQPAGPSIEVASAEPPPSPPPAQMVPSNTVAMAPMVNLSLPVSPYEQQWLAQSNPPPMQAPVDPFMQVNNYTGPNTVPMQNQWANAQVAAAHQNGQRVPPPPYPQYGPPPAAQGMNIQNQQGQVPPPNMPIPSGISTLPAQGGGYYQPHPGGAASAVQPNPGNYYNVPPTYRRVY